MTLAQCVNQTAGNNVPPGLALLLVNLRASPNLSGATRASLRSGPTPVMMAMTLMVSPNPGSWRAPQMTLASSLTLKSSNQPPDWLIPMSHIGLQ